MQQNIIIQVYAVNYYASEARGKVVFVLVHGIGSSGRYFLPLMEELSKHNQVYAIDLPGYGASAKPRHILGLDEMADVVIEFILKLNISQPVLIGHSMGCQVIARVIEKNSVIASKVILIGPTVNSGSQTFIKQMVLLLKNVKGEPMRLNFLQFKEYIKSGLRRYFVTMTYLLKDPIEDHLSVSKVEKLIMRGQHDPIVPEQWARHLAVSSHASQMLTVRRAYHGVHYSHAKQVARICQNYAA